MVGNICIPRDNDVIGGRGKHAMRWSGNIAFNLVIKKNKEEYFKGDNKIKQQIAINIVNEIQFLSPPGRFLKSVDDKWIELTNEAAVRKTRQALRENPRHFLDHRQIIIKSNTSRSNYKLKRNMNKKRKSDHSNSSPSSSRKICENGTCEINKPIEFLFISLFMPYQLTNSIILVPCYHF